MPPRPAESEVFDPRLIPIDPDFAPEPALAASQLPAQALPRRFPRQTRAPAPLQLPPLVPGAVSGSRTPAAVLMPLVTRPQGLTVLLTHRATHLSSHAGQIAFPGGKVDAGDADATDAALREAEEEVGLPRQHARVLGVLATHVMGMRYAVTPVAALVQPGFALRPNPHEVTQIFEVPLAFLMNPAHHRFHKMADGRQWFSMPYVDEAGREHFIWGATAAMLRALYRFLSHGD